MGGKLRRSVKRAPQKQTTELVCFCASSIYAPNIVCAHTHTCSKRCLAIKRKEKESRKKHEACLRCCAVCTLRLCSACNQPRELTSRQHGRDACSGTRCCARAVLFFDVEPSVYVNHRPPSVGWACLALSPTGLGLPAARW